MNNYLLQFIFVQNIIRYHIIYRYLALVVDNLSNCCKSHNQNLLKIYKYEYVNIHIQKSQVTKWN